MSHEIYEDRFIAVRKPAWHNIGTLTDADVEPSVAVTRINELPVLMPLALVGEDKMHATNLVAVVFERNGEREIIGTAQDGFELLDINNVTDLLDEFASTAPLSAAGSLSRGSEVFFSFEMPRDEIAGEEYQRYVTYRHSYKPGVAHTWMYTPVRVVCRNTIIAAEANNLGKFSIAHTAGSEQRVRAAAVLTQATASAESIKRRLERLTKIQVDQAVVESVLDTTYAAYRPRSLAVIEDIVSEDIMHQYAPERSGQLAYANRLTETARFAYDRFNDEFSSLAGTAYALYQAIVETADWRTGRSGIGESALVGARAAEKVRGMKAIERAVGA